ncbi:MAG TPA: nucleotidyltransferase domain-containing protein [Thermomicrobiaceae bacterium]|nr:nucleotidyltransferase domain-containing protein [Thermomicrobiaceae bacterium]
MVASLPVYPLGVPALDALVAKLLRRLAELAPGRVHSLYLFGSHVDGSAAASSDLDLFVVAHGELAPAEAKLIRDLGARLSAGRNTVDLLPVGSAQLLRDGHWRLEANSRLAAGDDLRPRLPREPLDSYLRRYTHAPYAYMSQVLRGVERLDYPLNYPDPAGEFYGYDHDPQPPLDPAARDIRALVATVCWIASLSAGLHAGHKVPSKSRAAAAYAEHVGDAWTDFVTAVYRRGKERWGYLVPSDPAARAELRALCRDMLAFENRYLLRYRDYLLVQLQAGPAARRLAAERLRDWVHYPDVSVPDAVW